MHVIDRAQRDGVVARLKEYEDELTELMSKELNIGDFVNEADQDFYAESKRLKRN